MDDIVGNPLTDKTIYMDTDEFGKHAANPNELYAFFDSEGIFLPSKNICSINYLSGLLSGNKLYVENKDVVKRSIEYNNQLTTEFWIEYLEKRKDIRIYFHNIFYESENDGHKQMGDPIIKLNCLNLKYRYKE